MARTTCPDGPQRSRGRASGPLGCLLVSATLLGGAPASGDGREGTDFPALGREVVGLVREHFMDAAKAATWAKRHAAYADGVPDDATFSLKTNEALGRLETSHTRHYRPGTAGHRGLLAIFAGPLGVEDTRYDGIGADVDDRGFVKHVVAGGPADGAGLLRGDRILAVAGRPYEPVDPFAGRANSEVVVELQRARGGPRLRLGVVPHRVDPKEEWVAALRDGARVIPAEDKRVAYAPVPWCVGQDVEELLRELFAVRFRDADALVLDFRDGWGGCNPEFLNFFNRIPPVLTLIARDGERRQLDPQWRRPLFVLINGGTRSGKEVLAHAIREHGLGTLVGQRTAGFVVGGRPFLLSDGSLLYLAVMDTLVDGRRLEGVGVLPHVLVEDRLEYAAGSDPQLERAVELAAPGPGHATGEPDLTTSGR